MQAADVTCSECGCEYRTVIHPRRESERHLCPECTKTQRANEVFDKQQRKGKR